MQADLRIVARARDLRALAGFLPLTTEPSELVDALDRGFLDHPIFGDANRVLLEPALRTASSPRRWGCVGILGLEVLARHLVNDEAVACVLARGLDRLSGSHTTASGSGMRLIVMSRSNVSSPAYSMPSRKLPMPQAACICPACGIDHLRVGLLLDRADEALTNLGNVLVAILGGANLDRRAIDADVANDLCNELRKLVDRQARTPC
jgi:hypothetical protein